MCLHILLDRGSLRNTAIAFFMELDKMLSTLQGNLRRPHNFGRLLLTPFLRCSFLGGSLPQSPPFFFFFFFFRKNVEQRKPTQILRPGRERKRERTRGTKGQAAKGFLFLVYLIDPRKRGFKKKNEKTFPRAACSCFSCRMSLSSSRQ